LAAFSGCATPPQVRLAQLEQAGIPRELDKATLPAYVVEPPDILLIETVNTLRTPESRLVPGDRLQVRLKNGLPIDVGVDSETNPVQFNAEIQIEVGFKLLDGSYMVGSDGFLNLGPAYGKVAVANLTLAEAEAAIREHLERQVGLKAPEFAVSLEDLETPQPVSGEHLVRPDGRISLGIYGEVYVAGMQLPEIALAVKHKLEEKGIENPKIAVDVAAYNSKQYYVITDGGGYGEQVARFPHTGNETVLDAIAQIQGIPAVSSKHIWIARPVPGGTGVAQILEVEWEDIAALGQTATNYQILPGDRIYIQADHLIATNNFLAKLAAPIEQFLGTSLLGIGLVRSVNNINNTSGSGGGAF
jgi:protein involved in polysaccharide export with SLBB domain